MSGTNMHDHGRPWWRTRSGVVLCGFLLIAAFYLLTRTHGPCLRRAALLLILACPLMHLFMHHGHGGHGTADIVRAAVAAR